MMLGGSASSHSSSNAESLENLNVGRHGWWERGERGSHKEEKTKDGKRRAGEKEEPGVEHVNAVLELNNAYAEHDT